MKCPTCEVMLIMTDRNGVEIDYCPECRGVWLDKGELDKIIERSAAVESSQYLKQQEQKRKVLEDDDDDDDDDGIGGFLNRNRRNDADSKTRKKGGFLGNLFDFD